MKKQILNSKSFGDFFISSEHTRETKLDIINKKINWIPFQKILDRELGRKMDAVGNPSYPTLMMFKCILLQRIYNYSDLEMEQNLADRFSFIRFCGLSISDRIPDSSTICRFRNALLSNRVVEKLFNELLARYFEEQIKASKSISVDASIIESARHPRKVIENVAVDRDEPDLHEQEETREETMEISYSDDVDAKPVVKGNKFFYGYKIHMAATSEEDIILGGHVTPANRSDMNELPQVIKEIKLKTGVVCYADKGYCSKKNRKVLKEHGLQDVIMRKAVRNAPLSEEAQKRNKEISSHRSGIEKIFGNFKRNRRFSRSRYIGIEKVTQEFFIVAFTTNLLMLLRYMV